MRMCSHGGGCLPQSFHALSAFSHQASAQQGTTITDVQTLRLDMGGPAMNKSLFLVTLLASILTLAAAPVALAQSDPEALLKKYVEVLNRGDVAGAVALLADDAIYDVPLGLCA